MGNCCSGECDDVPPISKVQKAVKPSSKPAAVARSQPGFNDVPTKRPAGAAGTPGTPGPATDASVVAALGALPTSVLISKAQTAGMAATAVEDSVARSHNPKDVLIAYVAENAPSAELAALVPAHAPVDVARAELEALSTADLKARAEPRLDAAALEGALHAQVPKAALVELLLAKPALPPTKAEQLAALEVRACTAPPRA